MSFDLVFISSKGCSSGGLSSPSTWAFTRFGGNLWLCEELKTGSIIHGLLPVLGENEIGWAAIMPLPSFTVMN